MAPCRREQLVSRHDLVASESSVSYVVMSERMSCGCRHSEGVGAGGCVEGTRGPRRVDYVAVSHVPVA
jgi:hypothetical protein